MNETIELLKLAKKQQGITLKELSEKSGVSLGTVNKLFSGGIASVKVSTAKKLADALGVSLSNLDSKTAIITAENNLDNYGFIKCAALTNEVKVCDVTYNTQTVIDMVKRASSKGVSLAVFPELCISSYTAGDLISQDITVKSCLNALKVISEETKHLNILFFVGLPIRAFSRLYNCAVAICKGEILAVIPKKNLPNYNEFSERRYFCEPEEKVQYIDIFGKKVPFGYNIILQNTLMPEMKVACEICEDLWVPDSPSVSHALNGATIIVNLSTSNESASKDIYRRSMVSMHASKCLCAYLYASSGKGESTTDLVFGGHNLINEAGRMIAESKPFGNGIAIGDVDCAFLEFERTKKFKYRRNGENYLYVDFELKQNSFVLERLFSKTPFVPESAEILQDRCESVLNIQAHALLKRMQHINAKKLVLGVSGGLDSTLAMLVCERALKLAGKKSTDLIAITMPCFGTSQRTYNNAVILFIISSSQ